MTFDEWLEHGIAEGWCGPQVCYTHDGLPMTLLEEDDMWTGHEPCLTILRIYSNIEHKHQIEQNHPPSIWRHTNG